jgi:hypothetical protein|tara:strand:+ start:1169 stop:1381 length:213 start_codon:yes stop_codon:yes gene_type:complete
MLEVTIKLNDVSLTMKTDSDSVEDCVELTASVMSFLYEDTIDLLLYEEAEDDNIYCEGIEPSEEREIDGL